MSQVPEQSQNYDAVIPTSQLRWRMSQLSQAGVPFDFTVNGPQSVVTVPNEYVDAAQSAMATETARRRKGPSVFHVFPALLALAGIAWFPVAGIVGVVGFGIIGAVAYTTGSSITKSERRDGVKPGVATNAVSVVAVIAVMAILTAMVAVAWFGVTELTWDGYAAGRAVREALR